MTWHLHWFRRDLRVWGNPALKKGWKIAKGRTVGVFTLDPQFLARDDFSWGRFALFLKALLELHHTLKKMGGQLILWEKGPDTEFLSHFESWKNQGIPLPAVMTWNRDYEPFARDRDARINELALSHGIATLTEKDHLILEPWECLSKKETPYQVFTPFSKAWNFFASQGCLKEILQDQMQSLEKSDATFGGFFKSLEEFTLQDPDYAEKRIDEWLETATKNAHHPIPNGGWQAGQEALKDFFLRKDSYENNRDFPYAQATSQLSAHLKNGSLTMAQVFAFFEKNKVELSRYDAFFKECLWREFAWHILWHFPHVEKAPFQAKYDGFPWEENHENYERWCTGQTGFPIVDAGMRELLSTGRMHNRVRMIAASFLTKDLRLAPQLGEKWFMNHLLDGCLAANSLNWQWAASVGCDPQPWFRIFNPSRQSQNFDPHGAYIRTHIPELRGFATADLHSPPSQGMGSYPPPCVNHAKESTKTRELFEKWNRAQAEKQTRARQTGN